jgi:tRNA(fMet)-specific endonuclease VapC
MIVVHELLYGAARSARPREGRERVNLFVSRIAVLPFDLEAASHAADIRAELAAVGLSIGNYDSLIAGHARSRGLIVITGNLREFQRVPGLRCEDWLT